MKIRGFRQPLLLFVLTVLVPGLILTAFTVRMIRQEKELAGVKMAEERQRAAEAIGQAVFKRLENLQNQFRIRGTERSGAFPQPEDPDSGIILAARVIDRGLRLPWEDQGTIKADPSAPPGYRIQFETGERAEFRERNLQAAEKAFRRAVSMSESPDFEAPARLGLARVLMKSQRMP